MTSLDIKYNYIIDRKVFRLSYYKLYETQLNNQHH